MSSSPVGVIGLGSIGLAVAANLIGGGHAVLGDDRGDSVQLLDLGGQTTDGAADIAAACEVIFTSVPSGALADVVSDLSTARLPKVSVLVDLGISEIEDKRAARDRLAQMDVTMLDAPISGTPAMTRAHKALIFASGDRRAFSRVQPFLDAVGETHFVGDFGTGIKLKYVANLLVAVHTAAAAEALAFADALGLDLTMTEEILNHSAAASAVLQNQGETMLARDFSSTDSTVAAMQSVLSEISALGDQISARTPMLDSASRLYKLAANRGHGGEDVASLITIFDAGEPPA